MKGLYLWKLWSNVKGPVFLTRSVILGGPGFGDIEDCIIIEEFAYGCSGIATTIMTNNLGVSCEFVFFKD